MESERSYLDYNASAPLRPEARAAMLAAMDQVGNASSIHGEGRAMRSLLETARRNIATLLGASPKSVVFTSGATEAANLALTPTLRDGGAPIEMLIAAAGEHPCILQGHRFPADRVRLVPLTADGVVDLHALEAALAEAPGRCLVAIQAANNETGIIQPVAEAADLVHARGGLLVCDAVQAAGRIPCNFAALKADVLLLSAHKLGGPKGAGALVFGSERLHIEHPHIRGGGQESGARAGTENIAAIAGFGVATQLAFSQMRIEAARLDLLRSWMEEGLTDVVPDLVIFGAGVKRLPNTSCLAVPGLSAEVMLIGLDLAGVAISSGSACSSGKVAASHVLAAMGVDEALARGALRVSFGWATTQAELDRFCETFQKTVRTMRARRSKTTA